MLDLKTIITATISSVLVFSFSKPVKSNEIFYAPGCHSEKAPEVVYELDTDFVTTEGSDYSPKSCKGNLCWTWKVEKNKEKANRMVVFTSDLQFRITEARKKSVSQAVKNSSVRAENYGFLTEKGIGDAINNSVTSGTEKAKTSSSEFGYEWNLNALFHSFLAKAIAPVEGAQEYPFCISGAVDLYYQFLERGEVERLVEAFIMYRSFPVEKVEKMKIPKKMKTAFDKAVKLYYEFLKNLDLKEEVDTIKKDRVWAKACLMGALVGHLDISKPVEVDYEKNYSRFTGRNFT